MRYDDLNQKNWNYWNIIVLVESFISGGVWLVQGFIYINPWVGVPLLPRGGMHYYMHWFMH